MESWAMSDFKITDKTFVVEMETYVDFKKNQGFFEYMLKLVIANKKNTGMTQRTEFGGINPEPLIRSSSINICPNTFRNSNEDGKKILWCFKKMSKKNYIKSLDAIVELINNIEDNFQVFEEKNIQLVLDMYNDKSINWTLNFSRFARYFGKYMYTRNVLKQVYATTGLKTEFNAWLGKFKRTNHIDFYSNKDVIKHKKILLKELKRMKKEYKK